MDIFDKIIEALELERELGTRTVEIDRALLVAAPKKPAMAPSPAPAPAPGEKRETPSETKPQTAIRDFAFFTGKPLTPAGENLLGKMIAAMGCTSEQVHVNKEAPAKIIILLGSDALRERAPGIKSARGKWIELNGTPAITTFSPDFILSHFSDGSSEMKAAKTEVWHILQSAMERLSTLK